MRICVTRSNETQVLNVEASQLAHETIRNSIQQCSTGSLLTLNGRLVDKSATFAQLSAQEFSVFALDSAVSGGMPPKKKKGAKKKGKKNKGGKPEADTDKAGDAQQEEQRKLAETAKMLFEQTKKEESEFNEFQQQREKLNYFWIVEKKNLEDKKAELRNKERELQDLEEKHQVEIKVYKQRVKHLLFEHQNEVTVLKTEAETALKLSQDDHRSGEAELKADRRSLKLDLKEMELSHEDYLKSLKQEQDKNITLLRQEFERTGKELQLKYERKRKAVRDTLERRRKAETLKIQNLKLKHIGDLMKAHEKAFGEIKNYYNDITHNNLDLIKSLKEEVSEMKKKEQQDEKSMYEIAQENKRMSEPLKSALQDVERLRRELEKYKRDMEELKNTKARLLVVEDQLRNLQWEHEVLEQRHTQIFNERDDLYKRFQVTVYDVQQKSGFKNLLLERKLEALSEALEQKEAQLNEVLARANIDPAVLGQVRGRLDDIIESKNQTVRDLQQELERVMQAHQELIGASEEKLMEFGVPKEELGFQAQRVGQSTMNQEISAA